MILAELQRGTAFGRTRRSPSAGKQPKLAQVQDRGLRIGDPSLLLHQRGKSRPDQTRDPGSGGKRFMLECA